ncbi:MAG TPA: trimethylamine methyltransferase family protein [Longilinea sp.]|nr:trimethylamine methyltransferase family protein [Longilinea sp.]
MARRPKLQFLEPELVARLLDEAFQLLMAPGVRVSSSEARDLLAANGATLTGDVAHISEKLVRQALATVPHRFDLYDRRGKPVVHYGGNDVQFDPGSCAVHMLDAESGEHRLSTSQDLIRLVKLAEVLPQFAAQSTAVVCADAPKEIGDLYRLYWVLLFSEKPVVTGAFTAAGLAPMLELLAAESGGKQALKERPRAVFDVCPSPPLHWTEFAAANLIELARAGVPAEIVSMPLAGATAPVTLIGAITQHAAECLSGITIHQLAAPGAPIVWGGAPAIFDMRTGTTPMGAIETAMIQAAYAQVGQSLDLPTHGYLGASDAKVIDAQAGLESGLTAMIGALAGINLISGAGMLDFLACQSAEKLAIDAEGIAMAQRLISGIDTPTDTLATAAFAEAGLAGEFLKLQETRRLFRKEQYLPSAVIDRGSVRAWEESGRKDSLARAKERVAELLNSYRQPELPEGIKTELDAVMDRARRRIQPA